MLLNNGSLLLVVLLTAYSLFAILRRANKQDRLVWSAITLSFASSAAFGFLYAQSFQPGFWLTAGIGLLYATVVGAVAGRPWNAASVLTGGLIAWIGALLGIVLGTMLVPSNKAIMIGDVGFLACAYLLQKISERSWNNQADSQPHPGKGSGKKTAKPQPAKRANKQSPYMGIAILAAVFIVLAGVIGWKKDAILSAQIGQATQQVADFDDQNNLQIATIQVSNRGLAPQNTVFQAGIMIKAIFNVDSDAGTGLKLTSKELDVNSPLNPGENLFLIKDPRPGTYTFELSNGTKACTFTVR